MKLQIMSDLHLDRHGDKGDELLARLPVVADTLVIAGDLGAAGAHLQHIFAQLSKRWKHVLYVPGNHEYHGLSFTAGEGTFSLLDGLWEGVHILRNEMVTIEGQRFLGTTLWFPQKKNSLKHTWMIEDFVAIGGLKERVFEEHERAMRFLLDFTQPSDVVITHHLPSHRCVPSRYRRQHLTKYFVGEADEVVITKEPKLWVFGHTHDGYDELYNGVHLVCNPVGYAGQLTDFNPELVVEI